MEERGREHRNEPERESERAQMRHEEGLEDVGRKGGAASMAGGIPLERVGAATMPVTRDLVRWGPIWAGLLVALPIQLILGAIGLAVALSAYNPSAQDYTQRVGSTLAIWSAISALIALFIGGYIAGRMAATSGFRNGLTQGTIVWALSLVLGVLLSAMGAAGLIGTALNIQPLLQRGVTLTGPEAQNLIQGAIGSAWWFVVGALLGWAAAAGGGILGASARYQQVREEM